MDASEPADDQAVRDLSSIEDIDEKLARYRRAGDVIAAAKQFRRDLRWEILAALAGAREGVTRDWRLRVVKRLRRGYTVSDCDLISLFVEPGGDEGDSNAPVG